MQAKKCFGQNFLCDENIKNKIIQSIPNSEKIVEIGAGLGDLTERLLSKTKNLWCYEIDKELFELLNKKFALALQSGQMHLICEDALKIWKQLGASPYFLAANLPYYIATNIILRALKDDNCLGFVVMLQYEVAVKFSASVGQREFCALSVLASLFGKCELLFSVPPSAFNPVPKVQSAVIKLEKKIKPSCDIVAFEKFLCLCFSSPRKTLAKNLNTNFNKERIREIFALFDISSQIRPHQLDLTLFLKIFNEVKDEREFTKHN